MDLILLIITTHDELSAIKYLESKFSQSILCKFRKNKQFYTMKNRGRLRCRSCKKDFNPFEKSAFSSIKISYLKWLTLIKLFEISGVAKVAAEQAQVDYKIALKAFDIFRHLILDNLND